MADDSSWTPKQDMSLLCRVCANQHDYLIPIFEGEGLDHDMPTKMDKHLPIKVRENDKLPTQMCYQCASTIIAWSELVTNCLEADKKLSRMLKINEKKAGTVALVDEDATSDHYEDAYDDVGGGDDYDDAAADDEDFEKEIKQLISDAGVELGSKTTKAKTTRATTRKRKSETVIVKKESKKSKTDTSVGKSSISLIKPKEEVTASDDRCIEVWSCCTCERIFSSQSGLNSHLLSHARIGDLDNQNIFDEKRCYLCSAHFLQHIKKYSQEQFICAYCDELFSTKNVIGIHMKLVHPNQYLEIKPILFTCKLCCNKLYHTVQALQRHMRLVHDEFDIDPGNHQVNSLSEVTHPCKICSRSCVLSNVCTEHRSVDLVDAPTPFDCQSHESFHSCSICIINFRDCRTLWSHIFMLHKNIPLQCNLCSFLSPTKYISVFLRHVKDNHRKSPILSVFKNSCRLVVDESIRYQCCHCSTQLKSFDSLKAHLHNHTKTSFHVCSICQKVFPFHRYLSRHYSQEHRNDRIHECSFCGQKFFKKTNLEVHLRIHTGEKKFMCEECGASFTQWTTLKYHMNTHSTVRHKCHFCENTYKHPHHMKKHMKVHSGDVKHYICDLCGRDFTNPFVLKRHMSVHSDLRPFLCVACGAIFKLKKTLMRHQITCKFVKMKEVPSEES